MESTELTVDFKTYFDSKFADLEKRLTLRDELSDRAIQKAEDSMNTRLEGMNEFRTQLTRQAATFVPREEFDIHIKNLEDKMGTLTKVVYIGVGILTALQVVWRYVK